MAKVKITVTVDEAIYKLLKTRTRNTSKYVEQLIKADIFRDNELDIYSSIVKRLISDGYILPHSEPACDDVTYTDESQYIPEY